MKKIEFSQLQIKQDMDKIIVLHMGQLVFLAMALLIELMTFQEKQWVFFKIIFVGIVSLLFYKTLKHLYYTFWAFSIFFLLFYLTNFFGSFSGEGTFSLMNCYLFAMLLLAIEMYLLYSPIFYPVVRWWEYDFRYRHDLKAIVSIETDKENTESAITENKETVKIEKKEYVGRMTDVRRNAGCIQLFENLKVSENVIINVSLDDQTSKIFKGKIISKRQYSIGRPWNYGIKMKFENIDEQKNYKEFEFNWKTDRQDKIRQKFEK